MVYTPNNQLELMTEGQADWDTGNNSNLSILERGYHITGYAGTAVVSGQVCLVNSAGYVVPMDARSLVNYPQCIAYRGVNSGEQAMFLTDGAVNSVTVWSGHLKIGAPVFVAPTSPGFCVASYAGHGESVGYAIATDAIRFRPGYPSVLPELTTETVSVGPVLVGSYGDFSLKLANRGIARRLQVYAQSSNLHKVKFWSGSTRAASELLYETLTRSTSLGSGDVNSLFFWDQAPFPWFNTDTASWALVHGRIEVQSGSSVNTSTFSVVVQVERFR
jgi:hypothetical protein